MMPKVSLDHPVTIAPGEFKKLYELTHEVVDAVILESAQQTMIKVKEYKCLGFDDALRLREMIRKIAEQAEANEQVFIQG